MVSVSCLLALLAVFTLVDGDKKLVLIQTVWRHGDRSPTTTFPTDPIQEGDWTFGGTGWGQLSPLGMKQHFNLGKKLRNKYVTEQKFLGENYNSKEIYVRSTDVNRTIISAMSNLIGQYSVNNTASNSINDYPDVEGWPTGFIPIAVHTVDDDTDYLGNTDSNCPLRDQVWDLAKTSDEVKNYVDSALVSGMLQNLTKNCGKVVDIDNLWEITNALFIEQIYFNETLRTNNTWYTDDVYNTADAINDQVQLYQNGIFNKTNIVNGHDVGLLTRKIRGGPLLNDIVMHMNLKLDCAGQTTKNCTWINHLKNYIYSAHDSTIYALFSALLMEQYSAKQPGQYPMYSATAIFELYVDTDNNKPYFKILYHAQADEDFNEITSGLQGCPANDFCSFDVLQKFADDLKPDMPIDQWCFTDLDASSTSTSLFLSAILFAVYQLFN